MKATKCLGIAVIALSILASNAFALIKSPYPRKPTAPATIIVITDDRHDGIRSTVRLTK
jgi:hypothetical protein